jgi:hypothetical protein
MYTIQEGTVLYHGTTLEYEPDAITAGSWFSSSQSVASFFAKRMDGEIEPIIHAYRVMKAIEVPDFYTKSEFQNYLDENGIEAIGSEELADGVCARGLPGWILPKNYPDGDDIFLNDTSVLQFVESLPA